MFRLNYLRIWNISTTLSSKTLRVTALCLTALSLTACKPTSHRDYPFLALTPERPEARVSESQRQDLFNSLYQRINPLTENPDTSSLLDSQMGYHTNYTANYSTSYRTGSGKVFHTDKITKDCECGLGRSQPAPAVPVSQPRERQSLQHQDQTPLTQEEARALWQQRQNEEQNNASQRVNTTTPLQLPQRTHDPRDFPVTVYRYQDVDRFFTSIPASGTDYTEQNTNEVSTRFRDFFRQSGPSGADQTHASQAYGQAYGSSSLPRPFAHHFSGTQFTSIEFPAGPARLTPSAAQDLQRLARHHQPGQKLTILGLASDVSAITRNPDQADEELDLALDRTHRVANALIDYGIPAEDIRLAARSYPGTLANQADLRRVEIYQDLD